MEKSKFEEAKKLVEIIDACEAVIANDKQDKIAAVFPVPKKIKNANVVKLIFSDKQVTRSFLRWVENEKAIAEEKLKEI